MEDFLLVSFSLDRKYDEKIQREVLSFENIGLEVDDPIEKKAILSELPEWEITDIEVNDDGNIKYGLYFEDNDEGRMWCDKFETYLLDTFPQCKYEVKHIDNSNWEDEWKKSYTSFSIGNRIIVKPSWEDLTQTDKIVIEIDPKMAFGTGTHETTSMCMEYVENYDFNSKSVLDIGCGSGILSILSKKIGASRVDACDIDPVAVASTKENALINDVNINAFESDLFSNIDSKYDFIFANILAEVITKMLENTKDYMKEDATLILSGIINERENFVKEHLDKYGFSVIDTKRKNDWVLIVAKVKNA